MPAKRNVPEVSGASRPYLDLNHWRLVSMIDTSAMGTLKISAANAVSARTTPPLRCRRHRIRGGWRAAPARCWESQVFSGSVDRQEVAGSCQARRCPGVYDFAATNRNGSTNVFRPLASAADGADRREQLERVRAPIEVAREPCIDIHFRTVGHRTVEPECL